MHGRAEGVRGEYQRRRVPTTGGYREAPPVLRIGDCIWYSGGARGARAAARTAAEKIGTICVMGRVHTQWYRGGSLQGVICVVELL